MKPLACSSALALLGAVLLASSAGAVPPHPDKLTYPKFTYQPPSAKEYRTVLKSGPVAYVAEDRELPLVSVTVALRGGTYLDPAGKEGLAELAGYLLAGFRCCRGLRCTPRRCSACSGTAAMRCWCSS